MKKLILGLFISVLLLATYFTAQNKSLKRVALLDSITIFIITIIVCLIFKRPEILKNVVLFGVALVDVFYLTISYLNNDNNEDNL